MVSPKVPPAKLLDTAVTPKEARTPEPPPSLPARPWTRIWIFVAIALFAAGIVGVGADYWFRHESSPPIRPISVLKPIRQALPIPPSPPLEVSPDSLHVSAIVLGRVPLAVVNGKQLAEGDWLELRASDGVAALHVVKIEDGAVHFGYGGHVIYAKFNSNVSDKSGR